MAIGIKLKHSSGEITTGTGNLQLGAAGNLILDYATFPSADGTNTHVLSTDGAGNLSWVAQSGGSVTLSGLTDTNITTPATNALLQYDGANWIDAVPTTAHITEGANLYYTDARVDTRFASKDTGDLTEGSNLYFTNARADARITNVGVTGTTVGYWNTAFGWGNHASAGYLSATLTDEQVQDKIGAMLTGNTETLITVAYQDSDGTIDFTVDNNLANYSNATSGFLTSETSHADVVVDGDFASQGIMLRGGSAGVYSILTDASANWNTAFGWGDHASSGYLTSTGALSSHTDVTISGPSSGQHLTYNGSAWVNATVSAASAAGSDTYVQFNDGGNMGADAGLTYAKATDTLTAGTFTTSGASPTLTAAGALAITTTASNGSITITPHGSGDIILDGQKWPQADGTAGYVLTTNGSGQLSWVADDDTPAGYNNSNWDTAFGWGDHGSGGYLTSIAANSINDTHIDWGTGAAQVSTADIPEQTNLYYTDVRADARIVNAGSANWNTAYTHAVSAHAPSGAEANEYSYKTILVSGQSDVVADTTTDALTLVAGGNMTLTTSGDTITFAAAGGGGIALTDLSVTTGSASGAGTLAYNSGTGVFTYQPADLSSYLTSIDLNSLSTAVIDTATDSIAFIDANDSNNTKKESIADVLTAIAGTNLTAVGGVLNASGGGSQDVFKTIAVAGQSDVVADATTDTLTFVAGSNVTLTTDAGADSITIAASGGGGGGTVDYEEFKCNYATNGQLSSMSNLSSGISSVTIDSAAGGDVTVNFTGYTTPPVSIMFYGYGYASNIYIMNTLGSTGTTLRTLPGGGSAGSPTAFGAFASLNIRITEALTGASRSFGTVTHAWIRFVMGA